MASYIKTRKYIDKNGKTRTYYSIQVPVPKDKRFLIGKRCIVRYLGTKQPTSIEVRAAVANIESHIVTKAATVRVEQNIYGLKAFGPTPEQIAEAREALAAVGLDVVDAKTAERVTLNRLTKERDGKAAGVMTDDPLNVQKAVAEYLEAKTTKDPVTGEPISKRGDSTRKLACEAFCVFVGPDRMLDSLRRRDVLAWRDFLLSKGAKPATVNNKLSFARGVFHHFRDELEADPFVDTQIPKGEVRRDEDSRSRFSDKQARAILTEAEEADPETRFAILLAAYAGLRRSEIFALTGDTVDRSRKLIRLNGTKTAAAKRIVPLHAELISNGFLDFAKSTGNGKLFKRHVNRFAERFAAMLSKLKIETVEDPTTGEYYSVSFHSWRHCCKSNMTRGEIHPETRDRVLGHALPGMSDIYDKMVPPEKLVEMQAAIAKINYATHVERQ